MCVYIYMCVYIHIHIVYMYIVYSVIAGVRLRGQECTEKPLLY